MSITAFSFPGFTITGNADDDRFKRDIGILSYGGHDYVLHMMISTNAPDHATHSVARVERDGQTIWQHDRNRDAGLYTRLTQVGDEPVIGYVDQKSGVLTRTHPFLLFNRKLPLTVRQQITYKNGAADYLEVQPVFTTAEESFRAVDPVEQQRIAAAKEKREAEQAAREVEATQKRENREAKRKAVRQAVAGREEVLVRTNQGIKRGQPVLRDEIPHLEPKGLYVLVEAIDKDGVPYEPLTAFRAIAVKGKGIIMQGGGIDAIDFHDATLMTPEPTGSENFKLSGDVFEVLIYADKAAVQTLAKIGVDAVEFAAFPMGNNGQFRVFVLDGTNGKTEMIDAGLQKPYRGDVQQSQVA